MAIAIVAVVVGAQALRVDALALVGTFAALVSAVLAPAIGLLIAALTSALLPPAVVPRPGAPTLIVGAVLLGWVYRLPLDRPRLRVGLPMALLAAFVLYVGVQQLPELAGGYSGVLGHLVGYQFIQLTTGFGLVIATAVVLAGRDPRLYVGAAIASAMIAAVLGIATYEVPEIPSILAGLVSSAEPEVRAAGPFGNPNYFGVFEAMAVAAALGWATVARSRTVRVALLVAAAVCATGLVLTLSRGAILTLLAGTSVLAFVRYRVAGVAAVAVLLVAVVAVYPAFVEWRLGDTAEAGAGWAFEAMAASDRERAAAVLAGPQIWATAPLFGVGFGHYSFVSARFSGNEYATAAHNWYVNVLAEQGLVGIVLWLAFLAAVAAALWRRPPESRAVGFAVLASFAAASMFLEPPTSFQTAAFPILVIVAVLVGNWPRTSSADGDP